MNPFMLAAAMAATPFTQVSESNTPPAPDLATLTFDAPSTPLTDRPGDGRLWLAGATWKMSFGQEGATYIPFLGPKALGHTALRLRLSSATVGGEPLGPLRASSPCESGLERVTVDIDHGPLIERWQLENDRVEQTFVIDELPARAEIVITLDRSTDLVPRRDGGGWLFEGEFGSLRYGEAFAVDADGARCSVPVVVSREQLTLTVPASFVAEAALPLTIDPVLSTGTVVSGATLDYFGASATYDRTYDVFVVTVERAFSATDSDVYAYVVPATGPVTSTSLHVVDFTSDSWRWPRCADLDNDDGVGFAAIVGRPGSFVTHLKFRWLALASLLMEPQRTITTVPVTEPIGHLDLGADRRAPALAGEEMTFLAVYKQVDLGTSQTFIQACSFRADGSLVAGPNAIAFVFGSADLAHPSVSPASDSISSPNALDYLVAYEFKDAAGAENILYQFIRSDTALPIPGTTSTPVASSVFRSQPDVSGFGFAGGRKRAGIAHIYDGPASEPSTNVAIVEYNRAPLMSAVSLMEGANYDWSQTEPVVQCVGDRFGIAYLEQGPGAPFINVRFTSGDLAGGGALGLAEHNLHASGGFRDNESPSFILRGTFNGLTPLDGLIAWTSRGNLRAARVQVRDLDLAGSQYCIANPNSTGEPGWMRVEGEPDVSGASLRLLAQNLPSNSFGYFLCSLGSGFTPLVGGSDGNLCLSGNRFGRFVAQLGQTGPTSGRLSALADPGALPQATGTIAALVGDHWCFQCWHRDANHGGATSNLTNAVRVIFE